MPVCAKPVQQADGSLALVIDPSVSNTSACSYVVQTGQESTLGLGALASMTPDESLIISISVAALWAGAYGIRSIAHTIFSRSSENEEG